MTVASWLVTSPKTPLQSLGDDARDSLAMAQLPATFLAMLLSGNVHGGDTGETIYWFLVFLEWSIIGFAVAKVYKLISRYKKA
jgi:hypothetical protein